VTLLRLALLACLVAVLTPAPALAQECPGTGLLLFQRGVYTELELPADRTVSTGEALGTGQIAFLTRAGEAGCDPGTTEVLGIQDVPADVAVAVPNRPSIFVLGARCAGYEGASRVGCVLEPVEFDGSVYTGALDPEGAAELPQEDPLGEAREGETTVTAVRLADVDPAVGLGLEGRPDEVFVAAGACPYERLSPTAAENDLARCLRAPLWFVFDVERPPAARVGDRITANADRTVDRVVDGATVSLVRLSNAVDAVPADLTGAVAVGTVSVGADGVVSMPIVVPDVEEGLYEAVVSCDACGPAFGGETVFAAGSFVIVEAEGGGSGPRVIGILLGVLLFVALGLAIVAWRRGWWRPSVRRRKPR
jgi:hypothetical protein